MFCSVSDKNSTRRTSLLSLILPILPISVVGSLRSTIDCVSTCISLSLLLPVVRKCILIRRSGRLLKGKKISMTLPKHVGSGSEVEEAKCHDREPSPTLELEEDSETISALEQVRCFVLF